jgi:hypothetical protein
MEVLKVGGGYVDNLHEWKAKHLLKNTILGSLVPFQMNMFYFTYGITDPKYFLPCFKDVLKHSNASKHVSKHESPSTCVKNIQFLPIVHMFQIFSKVWMPFLACFKHVNFSICFKTCNGHVLEHVSPSHVSKHPRFS